MTISRCCPRPWEILLNLPQIVIRRVVCGKHFEKGIREWAEGFWYRSRVARYGFLGARLSHLWSPIQQESDFICCFDACILHLLSELIARSSDLSSNAIPRKVHYVHHNSQDVFAECKAEWLLSNIYSTLWNIFRAVLVIWSLSVITWLPQDMNKTQQIDWTEIWGMVNHISFIHFLNNIESISFGFSEKFRTVWFKGIDCTKWVSKVLNKHGVSIKIFDEYSLSWWIACTHFLNVFHQFGWFCKNP